jgi:hypothetical protein
MNNAQAAATAGLGKGGEVVKKADAGVASATKQISDTPPAKTVDHSDIDVKPPKENTGNANAVKTTFGE